MPERFKICIVYKMALYYSFPFSFPTTNRWARTYIVSWSAAGKTWSVVTAVFRYTFTSPHAFTFHRRWVYRVALICRSADQRLPGDNIYFYLLTIRSVCSSIRSLVTSVLKNIHKWPKWPRTEMDVDPNKNMNIMQTGISRPRPTSSVCRCSAGDRRLFFLFTALMSRLKLCEDIWKLEFIHELQ